MVAVVAESCEVEITEVFHSVRIQGKWSSVTVKAPVSTSVYARSKDKNIFGCQIAHLEALQVKSAEMLYSLYENVDKDPRVKVGGIAKGSSHLVTADLSRLTQELLFFSSRNSSNFRRQDEPVVQINGPDDIPCGITSGVVCNHGYLLTT